MFRRIANWFKERFGGATAPEEAVALDMMPSGPVYLISGFPGKTITVPGYIGSDGFVEPLVELTATETKVEHYARLSREIACEYVRHNGGTERSSMLLAALNVMKLKMTLDDVSRAARLLRQPPN